VLIARTPVRVSLAGGGTDLPVYYERHGGFVVSTSIDKYFYVFAHLTASGSVQISSSDYRVFDRHRAGESPLWDGDLGLVKAALDEFGIDRGLSLFLASQVPPGTGLGSSSTVAVALVKVLATLRGLALPTAEVAERACRLELEKLRSPIGKQDQYAAAFGGLNALTFSADGVLVEPLHLAGDTRETLEESLLLFFTGSSRLANVILSQQQRSSADQQGDTVTALHAIKALAVDVRRSLERGDLRNFGMLMGSGWEHKKRLAPGVSNPQIDELYELARRHGALGGKLAGAGGGGFLMLYCEDRYQGAVTDALEAAGLYRMDYRFDQSGAQVLLNTLPFTATRWVASTEHQMRHA
jgi:D-glycero-alpha-D-manno-heptose-7-phosphate kinase